jgi:hypothetical protein
VFLLVPEQFEAQARTILAEATSGDLDVPDDAEESEGTWGTT